MHSEYPDHPYKRLGPATHNTCSLPLTVDGDRTQTYVPSVGRPETLARGHRDPFSHTLHTGGSHRDGLGPTLEVTSWTGVPGIHGDWDRDRSLDLGLVLGTDRVYPRKQVKTSLFSVCFPEN